MDPATRAAAADRLLEAYRTREPIDPLTTTYPEIDLEDAYAIQLLQMAELQRRGRTVKGHKAVSYTHLDVYKRQVLAWYKMTPNDGGEYLGSRDNNNWLAWHDMAEKTGGN